MENCSRREFLYRTTLLLIFFPTQLKASENKGSELPAPVIISIRIISDQDIEDKTRDLKKEWQRELHDDKNKLSPQELEKEREAVSKAVKEMLKSKGIKVEN